MAKMAAKPPSSLTENNDFEESLLQWSESGKPWHEFVPRDINENRAFRLRMLDAARESPELQQALLRICKQDVLFFFNAMAWTYQPRDRSRPIIRPMITWPAQEEVILVITEAIWKPEHGRINIKKSREQGGTWIVLCIFDWVCRFFERESFLVASSDQKLVDSSGNEDSGSTDTLFSKLDFLQEYLPDWLASLRRDDSRKRNHVSYETNSVMNGIPTTINLGRGGRRTAGFKDESASMENQAEIDRATADAWHVDIKVSTPAGESTEFKRDERRPGVIFKTLHWRDNPQHNLGLYHPNSDGTIDYIDKEYWTEERIEAYDFQKYISKWPTHNPKYPERSPYYDRACETRPPHDIAQNLDISDEGRNTRFFLQDGSMAGSFAAVKEKCRPPQVTGVLEYDRITGEYDQFRVTAVKRSVIFNLWIEMATGSRPPQDRNYGMGIDVSQGTGYSNSVITIVDFRTREKIGEVVSSRTKPEDWEVLCVAVAKWVGGLAGEAQMIWGKQGPGQHFAKAIYELGHRNVYDRTGDGWQVKYNQSPGISEDPKNVLSFMTDYRSVLYNGQYFNPSEAAIDELTHYIFNETTGFIEHDEQAAPEDASGAKHNHGDRVVADAMANVLLGPPPKIENEPPENFAVQGTANPFSYAGRRRMYEDEQNRELVW